MASKKKKNSKAPKSTEADEKLENAEDESSEDETFTSDGAEAEASEPVVPKKSNKSKSSSVAIKSKKKKSKSTDPVHTHDSHVKNAAAYWPVDKDHGSAANLLRGEGARTDVDFSDDEFEGSGGMGNLILVILVLAALGVGVWQLHRVSSEEALAAREAERVRIEEEHQKEQLAKQKKYGVLRIESTPPQADVFKNGERIVTVREGTNEEIKGMTPMNMMNMDIALTYKLRLEKKGYEPYEFSVAEHLWTKDGGTGEYKFFKLVELVPNTCEYWFLYDAKKRREMKFEDKLAKAKPAKGEAPVVEEAGKSLCQVYYETAVSKGVSVTECTCKLPPEEEEGK